MGPYIYLAVLLVIGFLTYRALSRSDRQHARPRPARQREATSRPARPAPAASVPATSVSAASSHDASLPASSSPGSGQAAASTPPPQAPLSLEELRAAAERARAEREERERRESEERKRAATERYGSAVKIPLRAAPPVDTSFLDELEGSPADSTPATQGGSGPQEVGPTSSTASYAAQQRGPTPTATPFIEPLPAEPLPGEARGASRLRQPGGQGYGELPPPTPFEELLQLALQKDPGAMAAVGAALLEGDGVEADPEAAVDWLEQAAGEGELDALAMLGWMHVEGRGVARNEPLGRELLNEAALGGSAMARELLSGL